MKRSLVEADAERALPLVADTSNVFTQNMSVSDGSSAGPGRSANASKEGTGVGLAGGAGGVGVVEGERPLKIVKKMNL